MTSMIFVPSHRGISHNVEKDNSAQDVRAGNGVLLRVLLIKANE